VSDVSRDHEEQLLFARSIGVRRAGRRPTAINVARTPDAQATGGTLIGIRGNGGTSPTAAAHPRGMATELYHNPGQSLDALIGNIAEILNSEVALYCYPVGKGHPPEVICSRGAGPLQAQLARPNPGGLVGRALRGERAALEPLRPKDDAALIGASGKVPLSHALAVPVRTARGARGALIAAFSRPPQDHALTLWTAESCAALLALGVGRPGTLAALLHTSRLDTLTGCLNYRDICRELDREINRSTRAELSLSVCFIDLDNFKRVNDDHGHLHGNAVLHEVGQVLRKSIRSCDTVGRFGGDEFIAILPDTPERDAVQLAERLRSAIAGARIAAGPERLTASIGVAQWTLGATADELLSHADEALMGAKARLRRVGRAAPISQPS
jgi:diguanylate cyclase (GGDEF)-like protein